MASVFSDLPVFTGGKLAALLCGFALLRLLHRLLCSLTLFCHGG